MTIKAKSHSELVTRTEYEALLDRIEELEDALRMRGAESRGTTPDAMPVELVKRLLAGEHPVRLWREHRGLTRAALAEKAGLPAGYLSDIEVGKKPGSLDAYQKLAAALGATIGDIIPNSDATDEEITTLRPFLQKGAFNPKRQTVRFYLSDGNNLVGFTITKAALVERFGLSANAEEAEILKVFEINRAKIDRIAARLHKQGARRWDGYIVIDSKDI